MKIEQFWRENSKLWFNSTPDDDKYITDLFIDIHVYKTDTQLDWMNYVLYYDQIIKHSLLVSMDA